MSDRYSDGSFQVMDCWITPLATGQQADSLHTLRDRIGDVPESSLVGHFVAGALRPAFERRQYNNDFANWAGEALSDLPLGERLAMAQAVDGPSLREELAVILDARISEIGDVYATEPFRFVDRQIVAYPTDTVIHSPSELPAAIDQMSDEALFYHVLDAPWRRSDGLDDFSAWLSNGSVDSEPLRSALASIDVRFMTITDVRQRLTAAAERSLV